MGSLPGKRCPVDVYDLNPGRMAEICGSDNEVLKRISFTYVQRVNIKPRIE